MYAYIKGVFVSARGDEIVVENNGIGYRIYMPMLMQEKSDISVMRSVYILIIMSVKIFLLCMVFLLRKTRICLSCCCL